MSAPSTSNTPDGSARELRSASPDDVRVPLNPGPPTRPNEQQAYVEASSALEKGEYQAGIDRLRPHLEAGSSDFRTWHLQGLLLRSLDRRDEALVCLRRAVELTPDSANAMHALARTLWEAGYPASTTYGRALRLSGGNEDIICGLASALVSEGQLASAIEGLDQILSQSPYWSRGHTLLASLRWMSGEREGFARSFETALAERPLDPGLRHAQLTALADAGRYEAVLDAVASGRSAIGGNLLFDVHEAIALDELGQSERAEPFFAALADVAESSVQIHRIRHLLRRGRIEEAGLLLDSWLQTPAAFDFFPYADVVWRLLGDPRWQWLSGDDRFIGVYDIGDRLPPFDELADSLRLVHSASGQMPGQSVRGGTQTDGNLFQQINPVIVAVREAVREAVSNYIAGLPPPDERHPLLGPARDAIRFSGAWSVRLTDGGRHTNHVHPKGWISSALYVVLPSADSDDSGSLVLGEPQAEIGLDLAATRIIDPKPGRLALFPSWMWHGTRPFGRGERMTIAFDVARPQCGPQIASQALGNS